jgi:site-specific recombinase XerD
VDFVDAANWSSLLIRFPDFIDKVKTILRTLHYTYSTEKTYLEWICRFLNFYKLKPLDEVTYSDVREYLEYLATKRGGSSSTQRQALNAIIFLFKKILEKSPGDIGPYEKPKRSKRLPVVLTKNEVEKILGEMTGTYALMAGPALR